MRVLRRFKLMDVTAYYEQSRRISFLKIEKCLSRRDLKDDDANTSMKTLLLLGPRTKPSLP